MGASSRPSELGERPWPERYDRPGAPAGVVLQFDFRGARIGHENFAREVEDAIVDIRRRGGLSAFGL